MAEMKASEKFFVNSRLYNLLYYFFVLRKLKKFIGDTIIKGKVIEIGCGAGYTSVFLKDHFMIKQLVSTDYDQDQINLTQHRKRDDIIFTQADATHLNYKHNSFDTVVQLMAFHHIADWKKGIKEAYRVLKKGGVFVSQDIGDVPFNKLLHFRGYVEGLFSTEEYCSELKKAGFNIEKQQGKKVFMIVARK